AVPLPLDAEAVRHAFGELLCLLLCIVERELVPTCDVDRRHGRPSYQKPRSRIRKNRPRAYFFFSGRNVARSNIPPHASHASCSSSIACSFGPTYESVAPHAVQRAAAIARNFTGSSSSQRRIVSPFTPRPRRYSRSGSRCAGSSGNQKPI